jgi:beta-galactosidase
MNMGPYIDWRKTVVPAVPPDAAFDNAAIWQLQSQIPDMCGLSEILLQIDYAGDIARLSSGTDLLDDNIFNGLPWQIGLERVSSPGPLQTAHLALQILPMPRISPIYLDHHAWSLLGPTHDTSRLIQATLIPECDIDSDGRRRPVSTVHRTMAEISPSAPPAPIRISERCANGE